MNNYELLDMIGEVNEDYVLSADSNVARPRFDWKTLAVCAACAALVLCTYPAWQGAQSNAMLADNALPAGAEAPQLHPYTVVEGGALATYDAGAAKISGEEAEAALEAAPADEPGVGSAAVAAGPSADSDQGREGLTTADSCQNEDDLTMDSAHYESSWQDIPVQPAAEWYDALLRAYRLEENPEWYGGVWLAGDELLAVAIVDGFRTPELEAELREAAGAGAVLQFSTVKYSMEFLYGLMEPAVRALDGSKLDAGVGVDVTANCLGVDLYSDGQSIPDNVLAALAHLDPDGDAIRVRLFTQPMNVLTDEARKGPAPDRPAAGPVFDGARVEPSIDAGPAPAEDSEQAMPAAVPGDIGELPEKKYDAQSQAGYDIIEGGQ